MPISTTHSSRSWIAELRKSITAASYCSVLLILTNECLPLSKNTIFFDLDGHFSYIICAFCGSENTSSLLWMNRIGRVILSMQYGLRLDLLIFLNFFYLKLCEVGRFTFFARRKVRILEDPPTCNKGWKDKYFFVKREGLFGPDSGFRSAWTMPGNYLSVLNVYIDFAGYLTNT